MLHKRCCRAGSWLAVGSFPSIGSSKSLGRDRRTGTTAQQRYEVSSGRFVPLANQDGWWPVPKSWQGWVANACYRIWCSSCNMFPSLYGRKSLKSMFILHPYVEVKLTCAFCTVQVYLWAMWDCLWCWASGMPSRPCSQAAACHSVWSRGKAPYKSKTRTDREREREREVAK